MMKKPFAFPLLTIVVTVAISGVVATNGRNDKQWRDYGGGPASSHFVDADQIKKSNVGKLEVAWFYPYAITGFNPIAVDDVLYVLGRNNALIALDATTGREIWIHENLSGINSRGINYWQSADGRDRRLLFSINSYLQAIDAKTGKSIPTFGTNDVVSGKLVWQFHTIPEPGEFGYDTWPKDAYKFVGGANNWGEMSVDEERGIVFV